MSSQISSLLSLVLIATMSTLVPKTTAASPSGGILYPRESESREVKSLDGVWNFRVSKSDPLAGFRERWYHKDLKVTGDVIPMPVPSSYNDVSLEKDVRDHVGIVWYDRTFYVPDTWRHQGYHVWLRFGSVHYAAQVWINGHLVMGHEIGHLPFQHDITSVLRFGGKNRVTVAVDNTLLQTTVPQGTLRDLNTDRGVKQIQAYTFDFFNYAGIHRSVHLYTTPTVYIDDITINTDVGEDGTTGIIHYNITFSGSIASPSSGGDAVQCVVDLLDHLGNYVVRKNRDFVNRGLSGTIEVPNAHLWWPYLMHEEPGYLYTLQARLTGSQYSDDDIYRHPVGIRKLFWNSTSFLINNKPIYIRGFGRHEDSDIRGKGLDLPLVTKDYELLKWVGSNAYRTSHYPYAEEIMDFADQQGIMIINECPAVDIENFSETLLQKHKDSLEELIKRDKNRPSTIMWSVANEPRSHQPGADQYFKSILSFVRSLDHSRPYTAAIAVGVEQDQLAQYLDIIGFNRYNAWYVMPGHTEIIRIRVEEEAEKWFKKHNKPVYMSEYGADTMAGLHLYPSYVWSEEYQIEMLSEHFKAFDNLRKKRFFIGEMIWNFADFKTAETTTRVGGNKKGIFTRSRQPKAAAHHVRRRYWLLSKELDNSSLPEDTLPYTAKVSHNEL
uniref:Beta-glucuronidase n=1 Tax=Cacopsylla melanoneura TaxID=428564 RepID=A0A8D8YBZ1_9HEMI